MDKEFNNIYMLLAIKQLFHSNRILTNLFIRFLSSPERLMQKMFFNDN